MEASSQESGQEVLLASYVLSGEGVKGSWHQSMGIEGQQWGR